MDRPAGIQCRVMGIKFGAVLLCRVVCWLKGNGSIESLIWAEVGYVYLVVMCLLFIPCLMGDCVLGVVV